MKSPTGEGRSTGPLHEMGNLGYANKQISLDCLALRPLLCPIKFYIEKPTTSSGSHYSSRYHPKEVKLKLGKSESRSFIVLQNLRPPPTAFYRSTLRIVRGSINSATKSKAAILLYGYQRPNTITERLYCYKSTVYKWEQRLKDSSLKRARDHIGVSQILLGTSDLLGVRIGLKLAYQRDQQIVPADRSSSAHSALTAASSSNHVIAN